MVIANVCIKEFTASSFALAMQAIFGRWCGAFVVISVFFAPISATDILR
jgi:hypothetical protein